MSGRSKLRNADTDLGGLVQWLGRKLRNHNPMSSRDLAPSQIKNTRQKMTVGIVMHDPSTIMYNMANGRRFKIKIEEVDDAEPEVELQMVGY